MNLLPIRDVTHAASDELARAQAWADKTCKLLLEGKCHARTAQRAAKRLEEAQATVDLEAQR